MASNKFFLEEDIKNELLCAFCQKGYDNPKILPCGDSICEKCESNFFKLPKEKCKSCSNVHLVPDAGFPINKTVVKLMKKQSQKIYRGELHEKAIELLDEISLLHEDFEHKLSNSEEEIAHYCEQLRFSIDIKTESAINELNEHRDALLDKVNKHEKRCIKNFKNTTKFIEFSAVCLYDLKKWTTVLKQSSLKDADVNEAIQQLTKKKNDLTSNKKRLSKELFGLNQLKFYEREANICSSFIGSFYFDDQPIDMSNISINKPEFKIHYGGEGVSKAILARLNDNSICVALTTVCKTKECYLMLKILSKNNDVIKRKRQQIHASYWNSFGFLQFLDKLLIRTCLLNGSEVLQMYDLNFNLVETVSFQSSNSEIFTDNDRIYAYSMSGRLWCIYDEHLNLIESISIGKNEYPFISNSGNSQIELRFGHLFVYCNAALKVIDNHARRLIRKINLKKQVEDEKVFVKPASIDSFFIINPKSKKLKIFNFDLVCLSELAIQDIEEISSVSLTSENNIVIYDSKLLIAYVF